MINTVELIDIHGDDLGVACNAWYSTATELTQEKIDRVPAFIKRLATDKHTTPFEHSLISFKVTADIATHIHCLKHRIGISISAQSQRYKELTSDDAYIPEDWPQELKDKLELVTQISFEAYHEAIPVLIKHGLTRSRAKESARYFLRYNTQITWKMTFNLLSFIHFQQLRNDIHAQVEISKIAQDMLQLVYETHKFDISLEAWGLVLT